MTWFYCPCSQLAVFHLNNKLTVRKKEETDQCEVVCRKSYIVRPRVRTCNVCTDSFIDKCCIRIQNTSNKLPTSSANFVFMMIINKTEDKKKKTAGWIQLKKGW